MKVVIDTNILISLLFGKTFKKLKERIKNKEINLLISSELMTEFIEVLERPKFQMINLEDKRDLFFIIESSAIQVAPKEKIDVCRDPEDNIVLECAVAGNADFIITGDKDLLDLKSYKGIKIISPRQFK